jgi:signal transduction histidine kinase
MAVRKNELQADAAAAQAEVCRLAAALALAERDRQLLGFEIHDGIVQDLTAAAMHLEGAGRQTKFSSAEAEEDYARGLRLLRESIAQARLLIRGLATVELDSQGLSAALARLVQKFRTELGVPVALACDEGVPALTSSAEHLLLRIAHEALFNIWKHAQASQVDVRLRAAGGELELTIADNGLGFDPSQAPPGHFGLAGMRARAQILGAALEIASAAGQGTQISVRYRPPCA